MRARCSTREKPSTRSVPISRVRLATAVYIAFIAAKAAPIAMSTAMKMPRACTGVAELVCLA